MPPTADSSGLSEWQAARDVLGKFDEKLHDLRKYGFSFITGLLTVSALFATIQSSWKLAALLATLSLIVALDLVDRNYRVIQFAAAIDAQILERGSKTNLTQTISRIYDQAHVKFFFQSVYIMFSLATLLLGLFVLATPYYLLLFVAFAVSVFLLAWLALYDGRGRWLGAGVLGVILAVPVYEMLPRIHDLLIEVVSTKALHYHLTLFAGVAIATVLIIIIEKAVDTHEWVDFRIDKYEYGPDEKVRVMVSNLGTRVLELRHDTVPRMLTVHKEDDPSMTKPLKIPELVASQVISISPGPKGHWRTSWSDHRWEFATKSQVLRPGLYRVVYNGPIYCPTRYFRYELLDPNKKEDRERIQRYEPWKVAQRFLITRAEKTARAPRNK